MTARRTELATHAATKTAKYLRARGFNASAHAEIAGFVIIRPNDPDREKVMVDVWRGDLRDLKATARSLAERLPALLGEAACATAAPDHARSRRTLRAGSWLISLAALFLPLALRDDRSAEWTAELHAILAAPDIPRTRRPWHAIIYAAGTIQAARALPARRHISARTLRWAAVRLAGTFMALSTGFMLGRVLGLPGRQSLEFDALALASPVITLLAAPRIRKARKRDGPPA